MYVTRPLSTYQRNPSLLSLPPPEGPNSGILVIQDEEAEPRVFFGLFKGHELHDLPFPQNKNLTLRYSSGGGENQHVSHVYTAFIPVLGQPLFSNLYYAIKSRGKLKGHAYTSSTEEDMETCCFCTFVKEVPSQPFDPNSVYQKFEIQRRRSGFGGGGGFVAKSIASDGFPPKFLGIKGWEMQISTARDFHLGEAPGVDTALRGRFPDFNFPLSQTSSDSAVVGKWYCPFIFIKEGTPKDQMSKTRFYEMTLEQRWEQIFGCESNYSEGNAVVVDVVVQNEFVSVGGGDVEGVLEERDVANGGVMWYRGGESSVGVSLAIVERIKWEEQRFGWFGGDERQVKVNRVEEFGGLGKWRKFGCYVLVERFKLKRMDGSLVLTCGFRHTHHIRSKWD